MPGLFSLAHDDGHASTWLTYRTKTQMTRFFLLYLGAQQGSSTVRPWLAARNRKTDVKLVHQTRPAGVAWGQGQGKIPFFTTSLSSLFFSLSLSVCLSTNAPGLSSTWTPVCRPVTSHISGCRPFWTVLRQGVDVGCKEHGGTGEAGWERCGGMECARAVLVVSLAAGGLMGCSCGIPQHTPD